jgi:retron-type reverse transcriptase
MGTCFSVPIRMELAQPGNQILGGNHQLYNGAPGYTSSDKKSYPLFSVPSKLANKLGHRLNLQGRHSNMAYSGAARSPNRGTAGLPPLGRPERAEGTARITDLTRNARITVDLLSQAAHYGKSTMSKPLRRSELCTIHCVCAVHGRMWGTLHRYQLSNQLIAQGPNPSGSKIFIGFTKKGSKCLPDTNDKDYVRAGEITRRPNRGGVRRARNSFGFLQSSPAVKEPSSRSYCSIPEVSDNETSSRSNGSAGSAPRADWSDRVRMSVSEQIQAYLGPDNRYNGLIHVISDPTFLALCYESIRGTPGTPTGSDAETLDGPEWFVQVGEKLKKGLFEFSPARGLTKPGRKEKRPLGINGGPQRKCYGEQIVQKALELVLEAIYEPIFLDCSHGFRPHRSCHTALKRLCLEGGHYPWVVKGNIQKFFDSTPHKAILHRISQKVKCHRTLELLQRALRAGYKDPTSGRVIGDEGIFSRGSVLSPLLCNIILHYLDEFVMKLRDRFNKGKSRGLNPEYKLLTRRMNANRQDRSLPIKRGLISSKDDDPLDPYFQRILYVRYADDFVISVSGTRLETFAIQASLQNFLHRSLGLELSLGKTMVSHLANKGFHFLGAYCKRTRCSHRILHVRTKTIKQRSTERLRVCAPITKLFCKLREKGFVKRNEIGKHIPTARSNLTPWAHADILEFYNQKVRGTLNYYSFASNRSRLNQIVHVLHMSCALTLASKYKLKTANKTFHRFGKYLACPATGMSLFRPGAYEAIHLYNPDPIARAEQIIDISWWRSTRAALSRACALCGSTKVGGTHHIRYVKDVKARIRYVTSASYSEWKGASKRKQIPLCSHHHSAYNNGQLSQSEMLALSLYTIHGEMFNCKIESS